MKKVWVVDVSMGYGHQRAALPLQDLAKDGKIIHADSYQGIPESDKRIWEASRKFYEVVSRLKKVPVLGDLVFSIFDKFQEIEEFYPKTQMIDQPTLQLRQIYGLMEQKSWGMHLIKKLNKNPLPLVSTFFAVAFMAEYWEYEGEIWLLVTDTDASRVWAPLHPEETRIKYLVPTRMVAKRLERYGIPKDRIFYTGFPLPKELAENAKEDILRRVEVLDPSRTYIDAYAGLLKKYLGKVPVEQKERKMPVFTFAIGGAGAQEEMGEEIIKSLARLIRDKKIVLNLLAGTHTHIALHFLKVIKETALSSQLGKGIQVLHEHSVSDYLKACTKILRETDVLWTKPSELVFYAALGIPILCTTPLGSQEIRNLEWISYVGAGIKQLNPKFAGEWIPDLLEQGSFAEAALQGYVEMEKQGYEHIAKLVTS